MINSLRNYASDSKRILKIGQRLPKLWARIECLVSFDSWGTFLSRIGVKRIPTISPGTSNIGRVRTIFHSRPSGIR